MRELAEPTDVIKQSGMMDIEWYTSQYLDVQILGMDPVQHYLRYGVLLSRDPSPFFSTKAYLNDNLDVKENGINPLLHFISFGKQEGRSVKYSEEFDFFSVPLIKHSSDAKSRLETCDAMGITGWLCPPLNKENCSWAILLEIDRSPVAVTALGRIREDVIKSLKRHAVGFSFSLPESYLDGKEHTIKLYISSKSERIIVKEYRFKLTSAWEPTTLTKTDFSSAPISLFCSHNLKIQGAQTSLLELAIGLKERNVVTPVIYSPSDGPMRAQYEAHGIDVIVQRQPTFRTIDEAAWRIQYDDFLAGIKRLGPKIIIANTLESFHSAFAAQDLDIPHILIPRESESPETYFSHLPSFIRDRAETIVSKADMTVFVAQATRDLWEQKNIRNTFRTIHNGLSQSRLELRLAGQTKEEARIALGIERNDIAILSLGTVTERKGQLDLVKAIPSITAPLGKRCVFFILGMNESDYAKEIRSIVSSWPLEIQRRVHLLAQTEAADTPLVSQLYLASDIFVLNSRHESYPRVILEALYFGLAIVATPCYGVREQLVENTSVLYYEAGNIGQLVAQLSCLTLESETLDRFANAARSRFNDLTSYQEMLTEYSKVVRHIYPRAQQ